MTMAGIVSLSKPHDRRSAPYIQVPTVVPYGYTHRELCLESAGLSPLGSVFIRVGQKSISAAPASHLA